MMVHEVLIDAFGRDMAEKLYNQAYDSGLSCERNIPTFDYRKFVSVLGVPETINLAMYLLSVCNGDEDRVNLLIKSFNVERIGL